jgi:hypothetical protein
MKPWWRQRPYGFFLVDREGMKTPGVRYRYEPSPGAIKYTAIRYPEVDKPLPWELPSDDEGPLQPE